MTKWYEKKREWRKGIRKRKIERNRRQRERRSIRKKDIKKREREEKCVRKRKRVSEVKRCKEKRE